MIRSPLAWMVLGAVGGVAIAIPEGYAAITFSASGTNSLTGQPISASVTFDTTNSGAGLVVTLSSFGAPVHAASDVLTAVFFNVTGVGALSPVSAILASGSTLINGPPPTGTTLGDYWEYRGGLSGAPGGATRGISAAGFGLFGHGDLGSNSQNLGGFDYGIVNGSTAGGNGHVPFKLLENNSVVFTLQGLPAGFTFGAIGGVEFQYGTALAQGSVGGDPVLIGVPIPEPATATLTAAGCVAWLGWRQLRRHA